MLIQPISLRTPKTFSYKSGSLENVTNQENTAVHTNPVEVKKTKMDKRTKTIVLASAALAVASIGVSAYALKSQSKAKQALEAAKKAAEEARRAAEEATARAKKDAAQEIEATSRKLTEGVEAVRKEISALKDTLKGKQQWNEGYLDGLDEKVKNLESRVSNSIRPLERNLEYRDGIPLLQNIKNNGERITLPAALKNELRGTAQKFMTGKDAAGAGVALATLAAGSTVWLPTAESLPEKEGGLAEVPVQMAMNMDNLGINNYIVRPMIEIPGKTQFYEKEGKYYYYYPGLDANVTDEVTGKSKKVKRRLELEKVVGFTTNVFRNGKYESQPVEVFYAKDTVRGYRRLMFRNKDYFSASGLYEGSQAVSETERYTFFNKIMYEFMKLRLDPSSVQGFEVPNDELLKSIKVPDAVVLNDWHCGPSAALMRYKAPIEANAGELSNGAASKLKDMNLLYIVHNSDYQGDNGLYTSEIINTLFDKYALDVYENATTRFVDEENEAIRSLSNVLTIDGRINMANMGMCLANKVKPVSATYAKEMATRPERSRGLMHVTSYRLAKGTLEGASNGWDRASNEIAIDSKPYSGTVAMMNKDVDLIKQAVKSHPDFEYTVPAKREVKPVEVTMDINQIMENRKHNKKMFVEYLKSCLDFNNAAREYNSRQTEETKKIQLINFDGTGVSDLSDIDVNNLDDIPILTMGVRFVEQKGVDIATRALIDLYNNWENLYPGKPMPIVVIGGEDKEGPYRALAQQAKRALGEKGKHLLYMDGFTPNPAFYAGCDYTMRPSHFEPDGDKWESLYRGTPMIMTRVGGHIDSIKDGVNGYLSARTVTEICEQLNIPYIKENDKYVEGYMNAMASDYKDAIVKGLETFYNKDQYQQLVLNAITGEQSWVQKDADDKIVDCPLIGHMRDLGFELSEFPQIAESAYKK